MSFFVCNALYPVHMLSNLGEMEAAAGDVRRFFLEAACAVGSHAEMDSNNNNTNVNDDANN
jgi:hypothetical protein